MGRVGLKWLTNNAWAAGIRTSTGYVDDLVGYMRAHDSINDSQVIAEFARRNGIALRAVVPSLIQHDTPAAPGIWLEKRVFGPRRAACFLPAVDRYSQHTIRNCSLSIDGWQEARGPSGPEDALLQPDAWHHRRVVLDKAGTTARRAMPFRLANSAITWESLIES